MEQLKRVNVAIVGGGPGCKVIMDMIFAEKLMELQMKLIGVACTNPKAVGYLYAQEKGIYTTSDYCDLYKFRNLNIIIELTGCDEIAHDISRTKPDHIRLIDHVAARLFWDIFQVEEALRKSEAKYRTLIESSLTGIYIDQDGKIAFANKKFSEIYGYSKNELVGMESWRLVHPEDRALTDEMRTKRLKGEEVSPRYEARALTKDGETIWIARRNTQIEYRGRPAILGNIVDITDRKRAEQALRESEEFSSSLLTNSPKPILVINTDSSIRYVNPSLERLTGFSSSELVGRKPPYPWWTPETREKTSGDLEQAMLKGAERLEEFFQKKNGQPFWVEITSAPVSGNGEFKYYLANWDEITDRKRTERALRKSEQEKEAILNSMSEAVIYHDTDHRMAWANRVARERLGLAPEQLAGRYCYEMWHRRDKPCPGCPVVKAYETGQPQQAEIASPDGRVWFVRGYPVRHGNENIAGVVEVTMEITDRKRADQALETAYNQSIIYAQELRREIEERKRASKERKKLEAELLHAQKMESIGTLAGGVAHDFNNLLMGIQGNVSLMLMDTDSSHPYYERLEKIEKQVQSGARLTSHLLGYARKGKYKVKPVDLNQLVEESCETFARTRKQITVHRDFAKNLFAIEADPGQIEQVLWNLFANAADAMPAGGDLFLKTMNVAHEDMMGKLYKPKLGNYVMLTVTDSGTGMDKEIMERVFDPFFTTKEMGRGTGLGLASVYGIIKGHGGYIDVESQKGRGTTFSTYLPASKKRILKVVKAAEKVMEGTGTILLVDDEAVILEVGRDLLKAMGYRVLVARDGKQGVEVYRKNQDEIDIVVLDLIMPHMGGGEAYDRMKEINPDIKVLLSSGFSIEGGATEILERGCDGFIQKPFKMKELSQVIRGILGKE